MSGCVSAVSGDTDERFNTKHNSLDIVEDKKEGSVCVCVCLSMSVCVCVWYDIGCFSISDLDVISRTETQIWNENKTYQQKSA